MTQSSTSLLKRGAVLAVVLAALAHFYIYRCPADYRNKLVVLTGASSGIGAELAVSLGKQGAHLVIAARRKTELERIAQAARDAGAASVTTFPADMGNPSDCVSLVRATEEAHPGKGVDVLLLNHAISEEILVADYNNTEEIEHSVGRTMGANFMGSVHTTRAALPLLERAKGHIAVVSSASAKTPAPFHAAYAASKRALHGFFDTFRHELHLVGSDVSVGILTLGLIGTPNITQDEGLTPLAMPVPACASEMLCAIAAGWEESYVPKWYGILTPILNLNSALTEWIANMNYIAKVERYQPRIAAVRERTERWRKTKGSAAEGEVV